jgi:choline dehydrogenase
MEDHSLDASSMRGSGGPLGITVATGTDDETVRLLLEATEKAGWPHVEDVNAEDAQHIGFTPATIKKGIRQSTANAFLWPIRRRKNLTIATNTPSIACALTTRGRSASSPRTPSTEPAET